jgi:membrane peptidoglycan carboxypeptidase
MEDTARNRTVLLAKLAGTIVVAGAIVAAMLFPFIGGGGLVARNSASLIDALPVQLTDQAPAGNTKVLGADGRLITMFYSNNRQPVRSNQIAKIMKQALVDIEDSRFYKHNGLDVQGTVRALMANLAAGSVQEGGSTITQQLVKQTLLQTAETAAERQAAIEQNGSAGVTRKLKEARLALALEDKYSKDEILTRYLNIVYFGEGAYGIQAAAQKYFSVNAADLTLPQAAMLAGLVQSPTNFDPITQPDSAVKRRNEVLQRMNRLGHINDTDLNEISAQKVQVKPGVSPPNGCIDARIGGFFCAYLHGYLTGTLGLPESLIDDGGLTIKTTLRPDMQAAGDQAVLNTLPMGDPLAAMYTAVEPGTGKVLAMSTNRRYGCSDPDCESVVLNTAYSQGSGSTYKTFVAAAALARGYSKYYTLTTGNHYTSHVYKNGGAPYSVENAGNYPATLTMEKGLYMSSNTYFVGLEDALGAVKEPVQMAEKMGMHFQNPPADQIIAENNGSFTLGPYPTSPLDLASAYSTLAANGTQCDPTPVAEILDRNGKPLLTDDGKPVIKTDNCHKNAIPQGVATTLNQILRRDVEPGNPGQTASRAFIPGHQIAGKTGTSQSNFSVAFVGYTPKYTASVMVLNPKRNQNVGGFGGGKGATIWHDAMVPIIGAEPDVPFPPADPTVENGNTQVVPYCGGVGSCQTALANAGFQSTVVEADSDKPAGQFAGLSPASGSRAPRDQVVSILVSNGSGYVAPQPTPTPTQASPTNNNGNNNGGGRRHRGGGGAPSTP